METIVCIEVFPTQNILPLNVYLELELRSLEVKLPFILLHFADWQ